jgi:hypothetical protein
MQSIRNRYGVPAKRGARVICNGDPATITGSSRTAEHLMVRFDDEPGRTYPIHPTWRVEYLAEVGLTEKNTEKENTMEHCDFCETTVESVSTGGGVGICADCRGEAEVSR